MSSCSTSATALRVSYSRFRISKPSVATSQTHQLPNAAAAVSRQYDASLSQYVDGRVSRVQHCVRRQLSAREQHRARSQSRSPGKSKTKRSCSARASTSESKARRATFCRPINRRSRASPARARRARPRNPSTPARFGSSINGESTTFLVLQRQVELAQARGAELEAQTDLNKAVVELQRVEGTILTDNGVNLKTLGSEALATTTP